MAGAIRATMTPSTQPERNPATPPIRTEKHVWPAAKVATALARTWMWIWATITQPRPTIRLRIWRTKRQTATTSPEVGRAMCSSQGRTLRIEHLLPPQVWYSNKFYNFAFKRATTRREGRTLYIPDKNFPKQPIIRLALLLRLTL